MIGRSLILAAAIATHAVVAQAQSDLARAEVSFVFDGVSLNISPNFAEAPKYAARFAAVPASCDPDCIVPQRVADGIETVTEPEVLEFLVNGVAQSQGLLVDSRMPAGRSMGFVPGSVSLPHETMSENSAFRDDILKALGARAFEDVFNFADAQSLVVFDNGPSQNAAGLLIAHLLEVGYPPEKLRYYRGGMQVWSVVGLTVQE